MTTHPQVSDDADPVAGLLQRVARAIDGAALELVVHVGAGAEALQTYARLQAHRLVLVEGDPETASRLRSEARQHAGRVDVVGEAVAAEPGPLPWNRYNLRNLNGPLDAMALHDVYPRLQHLGSGSTEATAFGALLGRLAGDTSVDSDSGAAKRVLVMDVPGQAKQLLASVEPRILRMFHWLVVCLQRPAAVAPGTHDEQADSWLARSFFMPVETISEGTLWPVALYRFDPVAMERQAWQERLDAARRSADEHAARIGQLEQALHDRDRLATERQVHADSIGRNLQQQTRLVAEQASHIAAMTLDSEARARAHEALVEDKDAAQRLADERSAQVEQLEQELQQRDRLAAERDARIDALIQDSDASARARETLVEDKDAAQQLADERAAQVEQLEQELQERDRIAGEQDARIEVLTQERDALVKEKAALIAARDELSKAGGQARQRASQLDAELVDTGARFGLLQEELIKAEAQIEFFADLLVREPRR